MKDVSRDVMPFYHYLAQGHSRRRRPCTASRIGCRCQRWMLMNLSRLFQHDSLICRSMAAALNLLYQQTKITPHRNSFVMNGIDGRADEARRRRRRRPKYQQYLLAIEGDGICRPKLYRHFIHFPGVIASRHCPSPLGASGQYIFGAMLIRRCFAMMFSSVTSQQPHV